MLNFRIANVRSALLLTAALTCLLAFVGCSSSSNPAGPDENPVPEIKKPTTMVITSIEVSSFRNKDWDPSELINAWKRADIFVTLKRAGAGSEDYTSDVRSNASATSRHTFTKTGVLLGKALPLSYNFVDALTIRLWDQEVFTNELMSTINFTGADLYANDEATTFAKTFTGSNSAKIVVRGQFKY